MSLEGLGFSLVSEFSGRRALRRRASSQCGRTSWFQCRHSPSVSGFPYLFADTFYPMRHYRSRPFCPLTPNPTPSFDGESGLTWRVDLQGSRGISVTIVFCWIRHLIFWRDLHPYRCDYTDAPGQNADSRTGITRGRRTREPCAMQQRLRHRPRYPLRATPRAAAGTRPAARGGPGGVSIGAF